MAVIKVFMPHQFEVTTALLASAYSQNPSGLNLSDNGHVTLKLYDAEGDEVTEAGVDGVNLATVVTTIVDWMPPYDYMLIGGDVYQAVVPSTDIRLWRIMNPGGGAACVLLNAGGLNLRYMGTGHLVKNTNPDTHAAAYNGGSGTNRMRFLLRHNAGVQHTIMINLLLTRIIEI